MRPPICAICDLPLDELGDLVAFVKTADDLAWDAKVVREKLVGHPPYAEWFCSRHMELARKNSHLTRSEALTHIRNIDSSGFRDLAPPPKS